MELLADVLESFLVIGIVLFTWFVSTCENPSDLQNAPFKHQSSIFVPEETFAAAEIDGGQVTRQKNDAAALHVPRIYYSLRKKIVSRFPHIELPDPDEGPSLSCVLA